MGKRGPPKVNDARLYIILPAELKARLVQAAKDETVSQIVRKAIAKALDNHGPQEGK